MKTIKLNIPDSIIKKLNTRLMAAQLGNNFSYGDEFALIVLEAIKAEKPAISLKDLVK
tara:strand:+ start:1164 stop:1337 length:174 start_codon:yes stop_codon:yes gene_type:complete